MHRRRNGMTMVEVLVTIAVIALLCVLFLPAIQAARESARRTGCSYNLRQMGIAIHNYESNQGCFPLNGSSSFLVKILPYMEQDEIKFDGLNQPQRGVSVATTRPDLQVYSAVFFPFLHCPSQPSGSEENSNYAGTHSEGRWESDPGRGVFFPGNQEIRARDITDGLSHTVMMSEWITGNIADRDRRIVGKTGNFKPREWVYQIPAKPTREEYLSTCEALAYNEGIRWKQLGTSWTTPTLSFATYNHQFTPNRPSCASTGVEHSVCTVGSFHNGGVHTLLADGSLQWIGDNVDLRIWRALATIGGGESVSGGF